MSIPFRPPLPPHTHIHPFPPPSSPGNLPFSFQFRWSPTALRNRRVSAKDGNPGKTSHPTQTPPRTTLSLVQNLRRNFSHPFLVFFFSPTPPDTTTQKLSLYLSYKLDDSYTPAALSVRAGTSPGDLQEVRAVTLDRPDGWITFDVSAEPTDDGEGLCVPIPPTLISLYRTATPLTLPFFFF